MIDLETAKKRIGEEVCSINVNAFENYDALFMGLTRAMYTFSHILGTVDPGYSEPGYSELSVIVNYF